MEWLHHWLGDKIAELVTSTSEEMKLLLPPEIEERFELYFGRVLNPKNQEKYCLLANAEIFNQSHPRPTPVCVYATETKGDVNVYSEPNKKSMRYLVECVEDIRLV